MGFALEKLGAEECARIAAELFKVVKRYGDSKEKLHGHCPLHGDKTTASFVYHSAEDWYQCLSCGEGGDLIKLWCKLHGLDSKGDGFKAFCREFGITGKGPDGGKRRRRRGQAVKEPEKRKGVWKRVGGDK